MNRFHLQLVLVLFAFAVGVILTALVIPRPGASPEPPLATSLAEPQRLPPTNTPTVAPVAVPATPPIPVGSPFSVAAQQVLAESRRLLAMFEQSHNRQEYSEQIATIKHAIAGLPVTTADEQSWQREANILTQLEELLAGYFYLIASPRFDVATRETYQPKFDDAHSRVLVQIDKLTNHPALQH